MKTKVENTDIISKDNLLYHINNIESRNSKRDKALVSFLYLTGARVSEVVRRITPNQLTEEVMYNKRFLIIYNVECLKRREGNKAKRNITISMEKEMEFIKYIAEYTDTILDKERPIFIINRHTAFKIMRQVNSKFFPHYLRHLRASHLSSHYGLNSAELRHFFGWSDDKPASSYVHLNWRDIARRMV